MTSDRFDGRTVLVIGGTTGIGRATAVCFARAGANVVVAGLGAAEGHETEAQVRAAGTQRPPGRQPASSGVTAQLHPHCYRRRPWPC